MRREGDTCLSPGATRGRGVGLLATLQRSRAGRSGPSDRRERVTERHPVPGSSEEHGAKHDARSEPCGSLRQGVHDEAGGVIRTRTRKRKQGHVATGVEWRSTGPEGGADGDGAEGAWCPVTRLRSTPGRRPRGGGRSPSFKRQKTIGEYCGPAPSCTGAGCPVSKVREANGHRFPMAANR